ncbi:MAG TPA: hypothetical protein VES03_10500 [Motilibacterales bacterium]|nr:hypothetical protein [Motilibacterales bacterium]
MTGLIYVAIIAVWAVVLVPAWLRRHDHLDSERSVNRFTRSLEALSTRESVLGIPLPAAESDTASDDARRGEVVPEVFTVSRQDLSAVGTRVSGLMSDAGAKAATTSAAARRRIVLGVLSAGLMVVAGLIVGGVLLPIALVAPVGLIVAFLAAVRHQVRAAQRQRQTPGHRVAASHSASAPVQRRPVPGQAGATWEARPATLPTYVTAPPAAEFPRVIDTATPGAWTAAAMLERAQQQKARAERMAAAKAEAIARAKAEQAAAEARSRDEEYLSQQSAAWQAQDTNAPIYRPRAVNE